MTPPPELAQASGLDEDLAQGSTLSRRLVEAYFEQQDSAGRIFLHRASVMTALHDNRLEPLLHKAICASGALVIGDKDLESLSIRLSLKVEQSILSGLYHCTLPRLQALTVLLHLLRARSSREALWMLLSIASRMAFTLRLNVEHANDSFCERESNRRLMWSLYLLDSIISAGVESLAVCPSSKIALRLPSNEYCFSLGMEAKTGYLFTASSTSTDPDMGELSYVVRLMSIRQDILRYARLSSGVKLVSAKQECSYTRRVAAGKVSIYDSREELESYSRSLCNYLSNLPRELQPTAQNIAFRADSESFTCFVMLHTIWHQLQCDLYRLLVPRIREAVSRAALLSVPAEFVAYCQKQCVHWITKLLGFWSSVYHIPNRKRVLDCFFAVCAYQASQVIRQLKHLCNEGDTAERLHTQLAEMLEMLKEIEDAMPFVKPYV